MVCVLILFVWVLMLDALVVALLGGFRFRCGWLFGLVDCCFACELSC